MPFRRIYRDELTFLRLQGREFARHNPQLARFLGEQAADPDVERLLEGFAFLTGKLRLKLEDDFEELTHSLLQLLWPNYLRPIPSMTIVRFDPVDRAIAVRQTLPQGALLGSVPVDGIACQFRTCTDLKIDPLRIEAIHDAHTREKSVVRLDLQALSDRRLDEIDCDELDLHLSGDDYTALTLYLWTARYLDEVRVIVGDEVRTLRPSDVCFPGFDADEALLPYPRNVFDGYRILQEYLAFPRRFYFIRLTRLRSVWPTAIGAEVRIEFHYSRPMPTDIKVRTADISLHCVPAINLFAHDAEPLSLDGQDSEYPLRPSGGLPHAHEVFSVDHVSGWDQGATPGRGGQGRQYHDFNSFQHEIETSQGRAGLYFRTRIETDAADGASRQRISFVRSDDSSFIGRRETISMDLTCTNRDLPAALAAGDVCIPTVGIPAYLKFANITPPTQPYRPVLDGSLHWTLISNLSLNYLSLLGTEPLKAVLRAYDFAALHDIQSERSSRKRLEGIRGAHTTPVNTLIKGLPVRGLKTVLELDQDAFLCEGELYLFGTVLARFFGLYASINSFHLLEVKNLTNNETYTWTLQRGHQPVI